MMGIGSVKDMKVKGVASNLATELILPLKLCETNASSTDDHRAAGCDQQPKKALVIAPKPILGLYP